MGQVLFVDGKVVYGNPDELQVAQLVGVREELERLHIEIERLSNSLDAAKSVIESMITAVKATPRVRVQAPPPGVPGQTPLKDKLK